MDDFCENFKGGYCEKVKMYVPRSWCFDVCKGNWKAATDVKHPSVRKVNDKKIKYPSIPKMGMNFAKAAGKHIRSGMKKRTEAEQAACKAICETSGTNGGKCENYVPETKIGPRCRICGCCMKLKTRWATAHCPLNKW